MRAGAGAEQETDISGTPPDSLPPPLRYRSWLPAFVAVLSLGGMGAFLAVAPKAAAGGWLIAFVFWSGICIGSLVAMMIQRLTGGRWGRQFNFAFMPTAAATPVMAVLFIPVLVALPTFFPWAAGPGNIKPDVLTYYLHPTYFIIRVAVAFVAWTLIAYSLPHLPGSLGTFVAAVGLSFYGLAIGIIGVDWVLSTEPPFMSTSFGASLAFVQLACGLAWALILSPRVNGTLASADVGGLLLATLLGITYVNFMAVLIIWYGDLPSRVFWFVHRDRWPWTLIAGLAFVFGSVVPIFALFLGRIRSNPTALRIVGVIALAGIGLYYAYLIAPQFGVLSLAAAGVALVAIGAVLLAVMALPWLQAGYLRWNTHHEQ